VEKGYKPGEKLITFHRNKPEISWACMAVFYGPMLKVDGVTQVRISRFQDEANSGRGLPVDIRKTQPYSDDLWAACQHWYAEHERLDNMLKDLRKGKFKTRTLFDIA